MDSSLNIEDIFSLLFFVTLFVAIAETLLITFWNRFYFQLGIPILKYSAKCKSISFGITEARLNKIDDDKSLAKIGFRNYSTNVFMFCESYFSNNKNARGGYTLLMRGMLYIDEEDSQVTVYGILNTYPIVFLALSGFYAFSEQSFVILLFLSVLVFEIIIYFVQLKRYKSIARRVASIIDQK